MMKRFFTKDSYVIVDDDDDDDGDEVANGNEDDGGEGDCIGVEMEILDLRESFVSLVSLPVEPSFYKLDTQEKQLRRIKEL
ncbi:Hypothetical predicted protein [Octopus vulgaris]|uniref:Uncharacterized protein n=1 Tax=Octopus vulgaris TaxID=6645 RepID=A0AA36F403_OCTVU|nr:Hypothetical predicted protein [Octopus vulgaris]